VVRRFDSVSAAAASRVGDSHRTIRYVLDGPLSEESGHQEWLRSDRQDAPPNPSTAATISIRSRPACHPGHTMKVTASVRAGTLRRFGPGRTEQFAPKRGLDRRR
jgi:hypothetical protein